MYIHIPTEFFPKLSFKAQIMNIARETFAEMSD